MEQLQVLVMKDKQINTVPKNDEKGRQSERKKVQANDLLPLLIDENGFLSCKGNKIDAQVAIDNRMGIVRLDDEIFQLQLIAWTDVNDEIGAGSVFRVVADKGLEELHNLLLDAETLQIYIEEPNKGEYQLWLDVGLDTKKCWLKVVKAEPKPTAPVPKTITIPQ